MSCLQATVCVAIYTSFARRALFSRLMPGWWRFVAGAASMVDFPSANWFSARGKYRSPAPTWTCSLTMVHSIFGSVGPAWTSILVGCHGSAVWCRSTIDTGMTVMGFIDRSDDMTLSEGNFS